MGSQNFTLYDSAMGRTVQAKVTWGESYDPNTNRSTITIQSVELLENFPGERTADISGVIKINNADAAIVPEQRLNRNAQGVFPPAALTTVTSPVIQHDATGAASMELAVDKNGITLGFRVYISGQYFYSGMNGYPSSYTVSLTKRDRGGKAYIDNGSSLVEHEIYIDDGSNFSRYKAYIDNGSSWAEY